MNRIAFVVVLALAAVSMRAGAEDARIIADFNGAAPNNLGGGFGAFGPTNEDGNACKETLDTAQKHGEEGGSLRLDYNVSKSDSFNGFWMKLGPGDSGNDFDASGYSKLTFWIKADDRAGIPSKFKVEIKGDSGPIAKKYIGDLSSKWTKVEIPLKEFASQGVDLTRLNEFCLVFEQKVAAPVTIGAVNIDDVALEK